MLCYAMLCYAKVVHRREGKDAPKPQAPHHTHPPPPPPHPHDPPPPSSTLRPPHHIIHHPPTVPRARANAASPTVCRWLAPHAPATAPLSQVQKVTFEVTRPADGGGVITERVTRETGEADAAAAAQPSELAMAPPPILKPSRERTPVHA